MANDPTGMASLQKALEQVNRMPRLAKAVQDVDRIIDLLTQAKAEVLRGSSQPMPPSAPWAPADVDQHRIPTPLV